MGGPAAGAAALSKMVYLALYNAACAAGWAYVLAQLGKGLAEGQGWAAIYQSIALVLQVVQTAAVLEIVHAATGLVRSAVFTTALQVGSRLLLVWQFLYACEECQDYYGMALACVSWSLVEIPRYLFYLVNLFGAEKVPDGLFWLRYSLFGILYPSGISGEILVMLKGLPWLQQNGWSLPPIAGITITAYTCILAILVSYIPGSPYLYMHMLKTRRSQFKKRWGKGKEKKKAA